MADKLTEFFNEFKSKISDPTEFQTFQAGFSKAAVSMRERAMSAVDSVLQKQAGNNQTVLNWVKDEIGKLPDIPE